MPLIRTAELAKQYVMGSTVVHALRGVSIEIDAGEFVAVMGPSGPGKPTFMNMLGCLDSPTSGRYWLGDQEVSRLTGDDLAAVRNRKIGFVFQHFNLLARTSARDNVALPLLYAGVAPRARHERAQRRLAQVGLADRLDHQPTQLSGGQQQRVAIARALAARPEIVICDEPTGNLDTATGRQVADLLFAKLADEPTGALDSRTSVEIMALLQALNREGITIVLVTHEHDVAEFAKRIVLFRDGHVVEDKPNAPRDAAAVLAATPGVAA